MNKSEIQDELGTLIAEQHLIKIKISTAKGKLDLCRAQEKQAEEERKKKTLPNSESDYYSFLYNTKSTDSLERNLDKAVGKIERVIEQGFNGEDTPAYIDRIKRKAESLRSEIQKANEIDDRYLGRKRYYTIFIRHRDDGYHFVSSLPNTRSGYSVGEWKNRAIFKNRGKAEKAIERIKEEYRDAGIDNRDRYVIETHYTLPDAVKVLRMGIYNYVITKHVVLKDGKIHNGHIAAVITTPMMMDGHERRGTYEEYTVVMFDSYPHVNKEIYSEKFRSCSQAMHFVIKELTCNAISSKDYRRG